MGRVFRYEKFFRALGRGGEGMAEGDRWEEAAGDLGADRGGDESLDQLHQPTGGGAQG